MFGMWSRADGGAAYAGAVVWLGCEVGGRGEADAVLEVREEAVFVTGGTSDKAARIFGVGEIKTIRSRVRWRLPYWPSGWTTEVRARGTEIT
jgi:hypothetical protein